MRADTDAKLGERLPDKAFMSGAGRYRGLHDTVAHIFKRRTRRREVHAADEVIEQGVLRYALRLKQFPQPPDRRSVDFAVEVDTGAGKVTIGARTCTTAPRFVGGARIDLGGADRV